MKITRKLLFASLFLFLVLMVACADEEAGGDNDQSDQTETETEQEASNDDDKSASSGGELKVAINAQPPTMDPQMTTATATRDVARLVFESLLVLNDDFEPRSEEHTSELQSRGHLVCRLLLEKKNKQTDSH